MKETNKKLHNITIAPKIICHILIHSYKLNDCKKEKEESRDGCKKICEKFLLM